MGICISHNSNSIKRSSNNFSTHRNSQSSFSGVLRCTPNARKSLLAEYSTKGQFMLKPLLGLYEAVFAEEQDSVFEINLSFTKLTLPSVYELKEILPYFSMLKILNLTKSGVNTKDLSRLHPCFERLPNLISINLQGNLLSSESGSVLSDIIMDLPSLKELNLSKNCLGDLGCEELHLAFAKLQSLKIVYLDENEISNRGFWMIVEGAEFLEYISLKKNLVDTEGIYNVKERLIQIPGLEIDLRENLVCSSEIQVYLNNILTEGEIGIFYLETCKKIELVFERSFLMLVVLNELNFDEHKIWVVCSQKLKGE